MRTAPDSVPLRVQLVVVLVGLLAVALLVTGVAGATALRGYLLERVDDRLADTARGALQSGRLPGSLDGGPPSRQYDGPALTEGFFTELVDESGSGNGILRVPDGSAQTAPRLGRLTPDVVGDVDGKPFTVDAVGAGEHWRLLVTALPDDSGALVIGTSLTDVSKTVTRLVLIQLVVSVIVLLLIGVAGYVIVRSSLRKLVSVEKTAAAIAGGDLSRRVDTGSERTEVGRLGAALNTMLGTIETSFASQHASEVEARASEDRMRRFVADASHELRTPLTSIRGFAELQRQAAGLDLDERNRLTARIEAEAKRMGLLVEDLLLLARLDQQRPLEQETVDVVAIVRDAVDDAPVLGPEHIVSLVTAQVEAEVFVLGDRNRLRQVVANLLSNAYVHTPPGTHVTVRVAADENCVVLDVSDDGPGLPEEDAGRVFERFYRSDPSRTRASGGSGLGLSIVSALVKAHGGSIVLKTSTGEGATFTVTLPRVRLDADDVAT